MSIQNADLAAALEHAADTADAQARVQHQAARLARAAARDERARVASDPPSAARVRAVLELLAANADHMTRVVNHLRRVWAATLSSHGLSARQVAAQLGISHQRVSVLLRHHDRATQPSGR